MIADIQTVQTRVAHFKKAAIFMLAAQHFRERGDTHSSCYVRMAAVEELMAVQDIDRANCFRMKHNRRQR